MGPGFESLIVHQQGQLWPFFVFWGLEPRGSHRFALTPAKTEVLSDLLKTCHRQLFRAQIALIVHQNKKLGVLPSFLFICNFVYKMIELTVWISPNRLEVIKSILHKIFTIICVCWGKSLIV